MKTRRVSIRAALAEDNIQAQTVPVIKQSREVAAAQVSTKPTTPIAGSAKVLREKPGYTIRTDLLKQCKYIAIETGQKIYMVIESALAEYIERYRKNNQKADR